MIGRKELGTPKNTAVLEDPPMSTDKDMIDLPRTFFSGPNCALILRVMFYGVSLVLKLRQFLSLNIH